MNWKAVNRWIDGAVDKGLIIEKQFPLDRNSSRHSNKLIVHLPAAMNFSDGYESTVLIVQAIRKLTSIKRLSKKAYKLAYVNFDKLQNISTSAALVLTAELSKWDDSVRKRLRPDTHRWNKVVLKQFLDLGFFELFEGRESPHIESDVADTHTKLVKYIKGKCGDKDKTKVLKSEINSVVGDEVGKWTFLYSGLSEAITNVSHHAYPDDGSVKDYDKNWYLTGSFDEESRELKIVFYDQGVGIPATLPKSGLWESIIALIGKVSKLDRIEHSKMLEAAVKVDRTRTGDDDRGKGLQDLLQFIDKRKQGYLAIMSLKGLYKYTFNGQAQNIKTVGFDEPMPGTLIVWSVTL